MSATRHCEECWAVLDPAKILRCTKCKACFYCSAACQKRNWRIHKRVCATDPLLRPFIRVEMAIERALKRQPMEQAPKDTTCYICLEGDGDGKSSKLMRGCACRGDSAGFVHVKCLTELAVSKEASGDLDAIYNAWSKCGNCKQGFTGALEMEMKRRFWRRYRSSQDQDLRYHSTKYLAISSQDQDLRYHSTKCLAICLGYNGEVDVANQLVDEASNCVGNNEEALLDAKCIRASVLMSNGQKLEALGLLQAILPEAKQMTTNPQVYCRTMLKIADVLLDLDRYQEAHEAATETVAYAKAKFGLDDPRTLATVRTYAIACANLFRVEEAKANFEYVLTTQTRVLGRDHRHTQTTIADMRNFGFAVPFG